MNPVRTAVLMLCLCLNYCEVRAVVADQPEVIVGKVHTRTDGNLFLDLGPQRVDHVVRVSVEFPPEEFSAQTIKRAMPSCSCISLLGYEGIEGVNGRPGFQFEFNGKSHTTGEFYYSIYLELSNGLTKRLRVRLDLYDVCPRDLHIGGSSMNEQFEKEFYINSVDGMSSPVVTTVEISNDRLTVVDLGTERGPYGPRRKMRLQSDAGLFEASSEETIMLVAVDGLADPFRVVVRRDDPVRWWPNDLVMDQASANPLSFTLYSPRDWTFQVDDAEIRRRQDGFDIVVHELNATAKRIEVTSTEEFGRNELPILNSVALTISFAIANEEDRDVSKAKSSLFSIPFYVIDGGRSLVSYPVKRKPLR